MKGVVNPKKFSNPKNFQALNFLNPKIKRVVNPKNFSNPKMKRVVNPKIFSNPDPNT